MFWLSKDVYGTGRGRGVSGTKPPDLKVQPYPIV